MSVDHTRPTVADAELRIDYLDPVTLARGFVLIDTLANPAYAGVRAHQDLQPEHLMMHARQRTLRYQLAHVPLAGGQLGLQYSPDAPDFADVLFRFLGAIRPLLESSVSLGPDANVSAELLDSILQRLQLSNRTKVLQSRHGWDADRWHRYEQIVASTVQGERIKDVQTALSVANSTYTATALLGTDKTIAVLGGGPFGMRIARYLSRMGAKVVALGDTFAAVHNQHGLRREILDSESLVEVDVTSALYITGDEFLGLPVDVIVAATNDDAITIDNVGHLRCKLVVEAATHALTRDAEKVLNARGINVVPAFAATVGPVFLTDGVLRNQIDSPELAVSHLNQNVQNTIREVVRLSTSLRIPLREAALRLAFHHRVEKHPLRRVSERITTIVPGNE